MKDFGRSLTAKLFNKFGGATTYTAPSESAITTIAILNPSREVIRMTNSGEVVAAEDTMLLQRKDVTKPVRNAVISYTDPDNAAVQTFLVDYILDNDTHVWRVVVKETT